MSVESNALAASKAIITVRYFLPLGAANKAADKTATTIGNSTLSLTQIMNDFLVSEYDRLDIENREPAAKIAADAALGLQHKAGTCETQASVAFEMLRKMGTARPIDFMITTNLAHAFVVIGLTGAAADWNNWGTDAVVCDPWLNDDPNRTMASLNPEWERYPYRPATWAARNLVLGSQTPQKLSSYTFKSQYRLAN